MNTRKALVLGIAPVVILAGCSSEGEPKLRPVRTKVSDQPLESEPSQFTITATCKVVDQVTRKEIPNATVKVFTIDWTHIFVDTPAFEVSFPAMSVVEIRAEAPGYKTFSEQIKAHYERNATLNVEIPLEPVGR